MTNTQEREKPIREKFPERLSCALTVYLPFISFEGTTPSAIGPILRPQVAELTMEKAQSKRWFENVRKNWDIKWKSSKNLGRSKTNTL